MFLLSKLKITLRNFVEKKIPSNFTKPDFFLWIFFLRSIALKVECNFFPVDLGAKNQHKWGEKREKYTYVRTFLPVRTYFLYGASPWTFYGSL